MILTAVSDSPRINIHHIMTTRNAHTHFKGLWIQPIDQNKERSIPDTPEILETIERLAGLEIRLPINSKGRLQNAIILIITVIFILHILTLIKGLPSRLMNPRIPVPPGTHLRRLYTTTSKRNSHYLHKYSVNLKGSEPRG